MNFLKCKHDFVVVDTAHGQREHPNPTINCEHLSHFWMDSVWHGNSTTFVASIYFKMKNNNTITWAFNSIADRDEAFKKIVLKLDSVHEI